MDVIASLCSEQSTHLARPPHRDETSTCPWLAPTSPDHLRHHSRLQRHHGHPDDRRPGRRAPITASWFSVRARVPPETGGPAAGATCVAAIKTDEGAVLRPARLCERTTRARIPAMRPAPGSAALLDQPGSPHRRRAPPHPPAPQHPGSPVETVATAPRLPLRRKSCGSSELPFRRGSPLPPPQTQATPWHSELGQGYASRTPLVGSARQPGARVRLAQVKQVAVAPRCW